MDDGLEESKNHAIQYANELMRHSNPKTLKITISRDPFRMAQHFKIEGFIDDSSLIENKENENG